MASRPSTPVLATPMGSVPLYDVPIMPTLPVVQSAETSVERSVLVYAVARPFSQSITALPASDSLRPPEVGHPSDQPLPKPSACTTANPRGTQVLSSEREMVGLVRFTGLYAGHGSFSDGGAPI